MNSCGVCMALKYNQNSCDRVANIQKECPPGNKELNKVIINQ